MADETMSQGNPLLEERSKRKKRKKDKKEKKRKRSEASNEGEESDAKEIKENVEDSPSKNEPYESEKDSQRASREEKRKAKRKKKEDLLATLPIADENGIKYTKLQIKRMLKRVKRGLHPIPTQAEEQERLRNEAQMRREDEAEFAGMIYQKEDKNEADEEEGEPLEAEDSPIKEAVDELKNASEVNEESMKGTETELKYGTNASRKKVKRSKPVPPDYVCQACNNTIKPAHWIYDCPKKVTVRGRNQKKKKLRGIHEPDSRKVYVSGLPFDIKPQDVNSLFRACGQVVSCKLIKFEDTGRCNGQAYVSFDTDEAASKALKLSGTMMDNGSGDDPKKKKGGKSSDATKRKQLKLKVSKAMNRRATSVRGRRN